MKAKEIDLQFEIGYIISLIALVVSVIELKILDTKPIRIFFPTIFFGIVHIIVLSLVYCLPRGLDYYPNFLNKLVTFSKVSLFLLVGSFTFLMVEIPVIAITDNPYYILGLPTIVIVAMGLPIVHQIEKLSKWDNISLLVNPSRYRVFEDYSQENPILVKITNNLKENVSADLSIIIPENITIQIEDHEYEKNIEKKYELKGESSKSLYLFIKSKKGIDAIDELKIAIQHSQGKIEKNVVLFILK